MYHHAINNTSSYRVNMEMKYVLYLKLHKVWEEWSYSDSYDELKKEIEEICYKFGGEYTADQDGYFWVMDELIYRVDCNNLEGSEHYVDLEEYRPDGGLYEIWYNDNDPGFN